MSFFFFKQKTAYEMRISDWSSDVCSSDLFPYMVNGTITVSEVAGNASFDVLLGGYAAYMVFYLVFLLGFFQMLRHIGRFGVVPKIGRASCRERVCQYV